MESFTSTQKEEARLIPTTDTKENFMENVTPETGPEV